MTKSFATDLRRLLIDDYHGLRERLARRFGSVDFASEVLHEAWLRLGRVQPEASIAKVNNPQAYLYRIALNIATDQKRTEKSWLGKAEIESIYRSSCDELDPSRVAEARSEIEILAKAINELPPRRRAVFLAARIEHLPHKIIAERLGITVRVVDRELKIALDQFSKMLDKNPTPGHGPRPPDTSKS